MKKQSNNCLNSIVKNSKNSFLVINTKGIITYCNTNSGKNLGYSSDQLLDKHISMIFSEKGKNEIDNNILKICNGFNVANYSTSIEKRNGEKSFFSINLNPILNSKLNIHAVSMYLKDLSSQRVLQREVTNKAKEMFMPKEVFIANLYQELRRPVNLIIGFLDIMLPKYKNKNNKKII